MMMMNYLDYDNDHNDDYIILLRSTANDCLSSFISKVYEVKLIFLKFIITIILEM